MADGAAETLLLLTADIVAAHVSNNIVALSDLPRLIAGVHDTLAGLKNVAGAPPAEARKPAVSIRNSIKHDYLVCLEDGKRVKVLKRHLSADHAMTVDEYRARWNLPGDYPMVAPAYAEYRRNLALKSGLGRRQPSAKSQHGRTAKPKA